LAGGEDTHPKMAEDAGTEECGGEEANEEGFFGGNQCGRGHHVGSQR
jgi:hypothetical protein